MKYPKDKNCISGCQFQPNEVELFKTRLILISTFYDFEKKHYCVFIQLFLLINVINILNSAMKITKIHYMVPVNSIIHKIRDLRCLIMQFCILNINLFSKKCNGEIYIYSSLGHDFEKKITTPRLPYYKRRKRFLNSMKM